MQKKAIIDVQFNWIFIIIAGAVILLFFVSVINKQKTISDNQISVTILNDMESILTGAKVSTGTVNLVAIPKTQIGFECDRYFIGNARIPIRDKVIFSPDLIKGTELITWALDWSVPFWATNFLYLTTKEVRYVIVDDPLGNLAEKIHDDWLPEDLTKELVDPGDIIDYTNNYRVKFIFVGAANNPDHSMLTNSDLPEKNVQAIQIVGDENTGDIFFYTNNAGTWVPSSKPSIIPYLNKESLLGAIFANDNERFECAMKKAYKKLYIMADTYHYRSGQLSTYSSPQCQARHTDAVGELDTIKTESNFLSQNPSDPGKRTSIYLAMNELNQLNGAAQLYSCVLIY